MNIKMKKLACLAGVIFAYFSIFFSGQITFDHQGDKTPAYVQISITASSTSGKTATCMKYESAKDSKVELFYSIAEY